MGGKKTPGRYLEAPADRILAADLACGQKLKRACAVEIHPDLTEDNFHLFQAHCLLPGLTRSLSPGGKGNAAPIRRCP